MDGNGRWARQRGLPRIEGHRRGVDNVRQMLEGARDLRLQHLTLFAFSVENWQRPADEIDALMKLLERFLKQYTKDLVKHKVRLRVIGRHQDLPEHVQKPLRAALEATKDYNEGLQLNVALNYGARTEILDAVRNYAQAVQKGEENPDALDWPRFENYLYTHGIPDPDLLIRTSGESRISNFLLLQCAYSELFFSPLLWPEFGKKDLLAAVENYSQRQRRFGKTGEQIGSAGTSPEGVAQQAPARF